MINLTIDNRIAKALGVGEDKDDQSRIAALVDLVHQVDRDHLDAIDAREETIAELEFDLREIREEQVEQLVFAQKIQGQLVGLFVQQRSGTLCTFDEEE
jgi:hypothetical protein